MELPFTGMEKMGGRRALGVGGREGGGQSGASYV